MDKEKILSLNGFILAFYQDCWDIIKEDLLKVFIRFHDNGVINKSTNSIFITLVPRGSWTNRIFDFGPISLVTNLYNIIAKVLCHTLDFRLTN